MDNEQQILALIALGLLSLAAVGIRSLFSHFDLESEMRQRAKWLDHLRAIA